MSYLVVMVPFSAIHLTPEGLTVVAGAVGCVVFRNFLGLKAVL